MDKEKGRKEYIRLRIKLAAGKIRVVKILLKNAEYRDVISRSYYAVYYAAKVSNIFRNFPLCKRGIERNLGHNLDILNK